MIITNYYALSERERERESKIIFNVKSVNLLINVQVSDLFCFSFRTHITR